MATPQTEIESDVLELVTESLEAFCEDMSAMFGVEMQCQEQEISTETFATLRKHFKKLVAVNIVDVDGALNGTFQLILDQEGLFTLGGVMVMLPEQRILANKKDASADLAKSMVDAIGEVGNLLVGVWERIFLDELEGHGRFLQRLPAFVGEPWDDPEETIGLSGQEKLVFAPYEMSIAPYPAFTFGVVFPKAIFESKSDSDPEEAAPTEDDAGEEEAGARATDAEGAAEETKSEQQQPATGETPAAGAAEPAQPAAEETPAADADTPDDGVSTSYTPDDETATAETPTAEVVGETEQDQSLEAAADKPDAAEPAGTPDRTIGRMETDPPDQPTGQSDAVPEPNAAQEATEEQPQAVEPPEEQALGPVSEAIKEMARSVAPPVETGTAGRIEEAATNGASELLLMCAKDIMQDQVVWVDPDESVQRALTKLQQHDIGYLVVGHGGVLEGIVSKADVAGAMSPYLRPMFGKWRRPTDDATLQIRLKWIMSRPVRMARPDTPLATILENMCRFGGRVLPVVDEQGEVHGLVTAFDIFQKLLDVGANVPTAGKAPQGPPL